MDFIYWFKKAVKHLLESKNFSHIGNNLQISDKMANAITQWLLAFYQQPEWGKTEKQITNIPITITNYMATLACNEITLSCGKSTKGQWLEEQIARFLVPNLNNAVQLAGAGGRVILKPYVRQGIIDCEVIPADRIYSKRINSSGQTVAGFFTDFTNHKGRKVVRVESFDLMPEGLYLQNKAFWYQAGGETLGGEISLKEIPEWENLEPDILIKGVDRPLFGELRMPFTNTVDETSKLPISMYANALGTIQELDHIYNDFLHEIHTGKRKRIVDKFAIQPDKDGNGVPYRDLVTDLYLTMDLDSKNMQPFNDYTPNLRVEEYQKALDIQCRLLEAQTGFSAGTFSFSIQTGKMTATQVISDDRTTYNTIKAIQDRGLKQGLLDLIYGYQVYSELYQLAPAGQVVPGVSFGDSIFEDTGTEFVRRKALVDGHYLKPEIFLSWYFGVAEEEAAKLMPKETSNLFGFGE